MIFSFGHSEHERVEIDVLGYERSPVGEYYDDNWLTVKAVVHAGGFRGKINAAIFTHELADFLSKLRALYDKLYGVAEFTTMEGQILLRLTRDGLGHIEFHGELKDKAGIGNCLTFTLNLDQTMMLTSINELEKIAAKYPVRQKAPGLSEANRNQ
jgi:hypothetical protein